MLFEAILQRCSIILWFPSDTVVQQWWGLWLVWHGVKNFSWTSPLCAFPYSRTGGGLPPWLPSPWGLGENPVLHLNRLQWHPSIGVLWSSHIPYFSLSHHPPLTRFPPHCMIFWQQLLIRALIYWWQRSWWSLLMISLSPVIPPRWLMARVEQCSETPSLSDSFIVQVVQRQRKGRPLLPGSAPFLRIL